MALDKFGFFLEHLVTREQYKARVTICRACEYYNKPTAICTDCGCWMKTKARAKSSVCTRDKWGAV